MCFLKVFQPYLRICVLPGDSWTCENSSTDKISITEVSDEPELIDSSKTSYYDYKNPSKEVHRPVSSYAIAETPELGNFHPHITPYPLIEIISNKGKIGVPGGNAKYPMAHKTEQEMENYLFEYFESQHKLRTRLDNALSQKNGGNSKYTWLRGIVDRILLFENYDNFQSPCESRVKNNLQKNNQADDLRSNILDYLVESYILGTRNPVREKSKKKTNEKAVMIEKSEEIDAATEGMKIMHKNPIDSLIDGPRAENNVVVIEGNLDQREYITINKYKSLSKRLELRVVGLLPCARGVRLPNVTDCTKYYTCDPETANIVDFSCPLRTAFNDFKRVCESQRYRICSGRLEQEKEKTTIRSATIDTTLGAETTEIPEERNPCSSPGKFVDSISDNNYYVCYSSPNNRTKIEYLKMTCPNNLIFCQDRRVCSTRTRCYGN